MFLYCFVLDTDQNNFDHDHMARFRYLESLRSQAFNQTHSESHVTEEELIMLGLNPEELLSTRNNDEDNLFMDRYFFDDESSSSDDDDDDENNFSYNSITNEDFLRSRQAIDLFHNQLFSTSNGRASARQGPRENTGPQPAVNPPTARSLQSLPNMSEVVVFNSSSDLSESTDSEYGSNEIINATSDEYEHSSFADPDSAHSNDDQNSVNDLDFLPTEESDDDHSSSSRNDILSDDSTNTSSSSEISSVENSSYIFSQSSISSISSVNSSECFFSSDQSSSSF